jgi:transcriptional regulator with XRE-family HTH domain
MKKKLTCYLRPYRRRWGLTQNELVSLLGLRANGVVSRIERQECLPSLKVAFALEIIFGATALELFPGLFAGVDEDVIARAYDLYERLQGNSSRKIRMKLDLFEDLFKRAKTRANRTKV